MTLYSDNFLQIQIISHIISECWLVAVNYCWLPWAFQRIDWGRKLCLDCFLVSKTYANVALVDEFCFDFVVRKPWWVMRDMGHHLLVSWNNEETPWQLNNHNNVKLSCMRNSSVKLEFLIQGHPKFCKTRVVIYFAE